MGARRQTRNPRGQRKLRGGRKGRSDVRNLCRSIVKHIDFHCTWLLTLSLGEGAGTATLDLTPPDGLPACAPEDRARIEAAKKKSAPAKRAKVAPFAGLRAELDGQPAKLMAVRDSRTGELRYALAARDETDEEQGGERAEWHRLDAPHLRQSDLARAFAEAGHRLLAIPQAPEPPAKQDLQADLRTRKREKALADENAERQWRKVHGGDLTGDALRRVGDEYNVAVAAAEEAARWVERAERRLHAEPPVPVGTQVRAWFGLLAGLVDPDRDEVGCRELLQRDLSAIRVTTRPEPRPGQPGRIVADFKCGLTLIDEHGPYVLTVRGTAARPSHGREENTVRGIIELMRQGVPLREAAAKDWRHLAGAVQVALGHRPGEWCVITNICDPRLLRDAMAICHPVDQGANGYGISPTDEGALPVSTVRRLARQLGEPATLIRRIAQCHAHSNWGRGKWHILPSRALADLLARAARRPIPTPKTWLLRMAEPYLEPRPDDRWVVVACRRCGSRRRARPLIHEIAGPVCLDCRTDDLGLVWPAAEYDRYLDLPLRPTRRHS